VLHRDVKPENVVFTYRDGVARGVLIDFGLAAVHDEGPLTAAGICVGSPSYLAPERLLGRAYDGRADVYAVGVILYEMLAGRRPFVGANATEIARAHLGATPVPLRALRPDVSPALEAIVYGALARRPADRFASADAMLAALRRVPIVDEAARAAARLEEASTTALATLVPARPSMPRRVWGWLRYGGWRWSDARG
jgi:serine/threonine protein kinase